MAHRISVRGRGPRRAGSLLGRPSLVDELCCSLSSPGLTLISKPRTSAARRSSSSRTSPSRSPPWASGSTRPPAVRSVSRAPPPRSGEAPQASERPIAGRSGRPGARVAVVDFAGFAHSPRSPEPRRPGPASSTSSARPQRGQVASLRGLSRQGFRAMIRQARREDRDGLGRHRRDQPGDDGMAGFV